MSSTHPGGFPLEQVPQIVMLAFDGAITKDTIGNYTSIINSGLLNPNGCPISMTFFAFHEYNDYNLTTNLYNKGQEIAVHSLSHTTPASAWGNKNGSMWNAEIGGITRLFMDLSGIPQSAITGFKAPFYQTSADVTYTSMKAKGLQYDSSFPTVQRIDPPIWPYTMDFGVQHDCSVLPCPTQPHPGIFTFPVHSKKDSTGALCVNIDCSRPTSRQEVFDYLKDNFERHFSVNRAPYIVPQNANAFFTANPFAFDGYMDFLNWINEKEEVYIVSMKKALEWLKNPVPLSQAGSPTGPFNCPTMTQAPCTVRTCTYDEYLSEPNDAGGFRGGGRIVTCRPCPDRYPWTCNPRGLEPASATCDEGI